MKRCFACQARPLFMVKDFHFPLILPLLVIIKFILMYSSLCSLCSLQFWVFFFSFLVGKARITCTAVWKLNWGQKRKWCGRGEDRRRIGSEKNPPLVPPGKFLKWIWTQMQSVAYWESDTILRNVTVVFYFVLFFSHYHVPCQTGINTYCMCTDLVASKCFFFQYSYLNTVMIITIIIFGGWSWAFFGGNLLPLKYPR